MSTSSGVRAGKAFIVIEAIDRTGQMLKKIAGNMRAWGQRIDAFGASMAKKAAMSLLPVGFSLKTYASFDDSLRKVEARSAGTADEMKALRDQAKELGRTTAFTAGQVGEMQAKMAQKGYNRSQLLAMTPGVLNLAIAAGEGADRLLDAQNAADLVSGTLRAFQMDATQSARVADIMSAAVNGSNFTLEGMITSLEYAAPVAKQFNLGLEDTVALLAGMTNLNIDPSIAGTAFRNMLLNLSKGDARDKFNANLQAMTGKTVEMVDAAGNLRSLPDVLFDIGEATKDLGSAERGGLLADLMGLRAVVPSMALGAGKNDFQQLAATLKNSQGVADKTAKTMEEGVGGSFRETESALEGIMIALGEALDGPLAKFLDWVQVVFGGIVKWIQANEKTVSTIISVVAGVAALGVGLKVLGMTLVLVSYGLTLIGGLLSFLATPLGLAVLLVAGLTAAWLTFTASGQASLGLLTEGFGRLLATANQTFAGISAAMTAGDLQLAGQILWAGLELAWLQGADTVLGIWDTLQTDLAIGFAETVAGVKLLWMDLVDSVAIAAGAIGNIFNSLDAYFANMIRGWQIKLIEWAQENREMTKTIVTALYGETAAGQFDDLLNNQINRDPITANQTTPSAFYSDADRRKVNDNLNADKDVITGDAARRASQRQKGISAAAEELAKLSAAANGLGQSVAEEEKKSKYRGIQLAPGTAGGGGSPVAAIAPSINKGLERSSLEAAEQFVKNRFNLSEDKGLALQAEANGLLQGILDNTDGLAADDDLEGV